MNYTTFEELKVWKEARIFVRLVYGLTSKPLFSKDYGLKDQIQRAVVSIMLNVSEGFERNNNKEFLRFLSFAKASSGEVRALLYISLDLNYITQDEFKEMNSISLSISTQIANFMKYLKNNSDK